MYKMLWFGFLESQIVRFVKLFAKVLRFLELSTRLFVLELFASLSASVSYLGCDWLVELAKMYGILVRYLCRDCSWFNFTDGK